MSTTRPGPGSSRVITVPETVCILAQWNHSKPNVRSIEEVEVTKANRIVCRNRDCLVLPLSLRRKEESSREKKKEKEINEKEGTGEMT